MWGGTKGSASRHRRTVTVLFCDLVDFTSLTDRHDPELVHNVVSSHFEKMHEVLSAYGGTIEKFIGDAIMAVFGYPRSSGNDALRAIQAARAMLVAIEAHNVELEYQWGITISASIGIETGEVVASADPSSEAFVMGHPVNTAARLEQQAGAGEVLVGPVTLEIVRECAVMDEPRKLSLKGKSQDSLAYPLLAVKGTPSGHGRIVGRDQELKLLLDMTRASSDSGDMARAFIRGDAGVGKSSLLARFAHRIEADVTLAGACRIYPAPSPLQPLIEMLHGLLGIRVSDPDESIRERIAAEVHSSGEADYLTSVLDSLLRTADDRDSSNVTLDDAFNTLRALLLPRLRSGNSAVLLFEDLHAAEPSFLLALTRFALTPTAGDIVLVATTRPSKDPFLEQLLGWGKIVDLRPLDAAAADELLTAAPFLLHNKALRQRIFESSGGNPLFIREFVRMLRDRGSTSSTGIEALNIPQTVESVIQARLDELSVEARETLQRASILGNDLPADLLSALLGERQRELKDLIARGFISEGTSGLAFNHESIRDVAYGSLMREQRVPLHKEAAAAIASAQSFEGSRDEAIGFHLESAFNNRKLLGRLDGEAHDLARSAGERLYRAGILRRDRFQDTTGAMDLLERAIELLPEGHIDRLDALVRAAACAVETGHQEKEQAWWKAATHEATDDQRVRLEIEKLEMDLQRVWAGALDRDSELERRALELIDRFAREQHLDYLYRAWSALAVIHSLVIGGPDPSAALENAIYVAQRMTQHDDEALASFVSLASALVWGPVPVSQAKKRVADLRERVGDRQPYSAAMDCYLGLLIGFGGETEAGRDLIERGMSFYSNLGMHGSVARGAHCRGALSMYAGDWDRAKEIYVEASDHLIKTGDPFGVVQHLAHAGHILLWKGDTEGARHMLERGKQLPAAQTLEKVFLNLLEARLLALDEDPRAAGLAEESLREMANHSWCEYADAYLLLADLYCSVGRYQEARLMAQKAHEMFVSKESLLRVEAAERFLKELPIDQLYDEAGRSL